jgi:hypothetical protein
VRVSKWYEDGLKGNKVRSPSVAISPIVEGESRGWSTSADEKPPALADQRSVFVLNTIRPRSPLPFSIAFVIGWIAIFSSPVGKFCVVRPGLGGKKERTFENADFPYSKGKSNPIPTVCKCWSSTVA